MKLFKITTYGLIFLLLLGLFALVIGVSANQPGSYYNKGHNAVWIGHKWVGDKKSDKVIQELVENFKKYDIDTVFVHSGPFRKDGTIDPSTYAEAINFIQKAKSFGEEIEYQAWLGQIRNKIDLADPIVRENILDQCEIFTKMVGFDGIHYDIEPVWDEDYDFILLLKETRERLNKDNKISVALAEFIPQSFLWLTARIHTFKNVNSEVNYENVARYADQVVVMTYDTGLDSEWLYRVLVQEQTIRVTRLLPDTEVFIGIPAYEDVKEGFNPEVENVKNGVLGIVNGLNNFRSNEDSFAGIAIYPYWEIDETEWKVYTELWMD